MSEKGTSAGDYLFTVLGATCAVIATLITVWIGKSIARMGHGGGHEATTAESHAPEAH